MAKVKYSRVARKASFNRNYDRAFESEVKRRIAQKNRRVADAKKANKQSARAGGAKPTSSTGSLKRSTAAAPAQRGTVTTIGNGGYRINGKDGSFTRVRSLDNYLQTSFALAEKAEANGHHALARKLRRAWTGAYGGDQNVVKNTRALVMKRNEVLNDLRTIPRLIAADSPQYKQKEKTYRDTLIITNRTAAGANKAQGLAST